MSEANIERRSILLVEDDLGLSAVIREYLEKNGFIVHQEYRGDTAAARIRDLAPDLVILDLMLPGLDGVEVCQQARATYSGPIMMLTARDEDVEQIVGLEVGADDYVIKPVKPRILLARIRVLLRRREPGPRRSAAPGDEALLFGRLRISPASRSVTLGTQVVAMTTNEFELLVLLAKQAGTVLSRDEIFYRLTGIEYDGLDRSVDIRISRLRKLLGDDPNDPQIIKTVRGQGYLFAAEATP